MSEFINKRLKGLAPYVPGEQPENFDKVIKLNTNESPFLPPAEAIEKAADALTRINLYSDPSAKKLTKAISEYLGVDKSNVSVYNSSDEALAIAFMGFCENGVAVNDITYGMYTIWAELFNAHVTLIKLKDDFSIDVNDYKGLKQTVVIANPNAPTGLTLSLEKVEELVSADKSRLVIVDEAYIGMGAVSAVPLIKKYDNLMVITTFSKTRAMAGARLGYIAACPSLIADCERIRGAFHPYNVNMVTQALGEYSLKNNDYFNECTNVLIKNREYLTEELQNLGFYVLDSKSNFIMCRPPKKDGGRYYQLLREDNVMVRYFDRDRIREYVRITVGSKEQLDILIMLTKKYIEGGLI